MLNGSPDPSIKPGARFQADEHGKGDKGWIRFVGKGVSPKQPEAIYVGVEWDDDGRGKHDGMLNGHRFFTCPSGKGAFIHPQRVRPGQTFGAALLERFGLIAPSAPPLAVEARASFAAPTSTTEPSSSMSSSSSVFAPSAIDPSLSLTARVRGQEIALPVQFVGEDKVRRQLARLDRLVHVAAPSSGVESLHDWQRTANTTDTTDTTTSAAAAAATVTNTSTAPANGAASVVPLTQQYPVLQALIADHNLLYSWNQLTLALAALPGMLQLSLSGNYLADLPLHGSDDAAARALGLGTGDDTSSSSSSPSSPYVRASQQLRLDWLFQLTPMPAPLSAHPQPHALQVLVLNNVPGAWQHVLALATATTTSTLSMQASDSYSSSSISSGAGKGGIFANLRELHLCNNGITTLGTDLSPTLPSIAASPSSSPSPSASSPASVPPYYFDCFPELRMLNLSENGISDWAELDRLSRLPNLRKLLVNNNKLRHIWYSRPAPLAHDNAPATLPSSPSVSSSSSSESVPFQSLLWLSVTDNLIDGWDTITELNKFPQLSELRMQGNLLMNAPLTPASDSTALTASPASPASSTSSSTSSASSVPSATAATGAANERQVRLRTIAMIARLQSLNLSSVRAKERIDGEKAYLDWAWADFRQRWPERALQDLRAVRAYLKARDEDEEKRTQAAVAERKRLALLQQQSLEQDQEQEPDQGREQQGESKSSVVTDVLSSSTSTLGSASPLSSADDNDGGGDNGGNQSRAERNRVARTTAVAELLLKYPRLAMDDLYPRFRELGGWYGSPLDVAALKVDEDALREGDGSALKSQLLDLVLRLVTTTELSPLTTGASAYAGKGTAKGKKLPPTITVGELTNLARKLFRVGVDATLSAVRYVEPKGTNAAWELQLEDPFKTLSMYNLQSGGEVVLVVLSNS